MPSFIGKGKQTRHFLHRTPFNVHNPTIVTDQTAWYDNTEKLIRRQIRLLCCEEVTWCAGVKVTRTVARLQSYLVGRDETVYKYEAAVERVMQIVNERQNDTR